MNYLETDVLNELKNKYFGDDEIIKNHFQSFYCSRHINVLSLDLSLFNII